MQKDVHLIGLTKRLFGYKNRLSIQPRTERASQCSFDFQCTEFTSNRTNASSRIRAPSSHNKYEAKHPQNSWLPGWHALSTSGDRQDAIRQQLMRLLNPVRPQLFPVASRAARCVGCWFNDSFPYRRNIQTRAKTASFFLTNCIFG